MRPQQTLHFELGRSVVGQCGSLITKVTYVKQGTNKQFAIVDAVMTDISSVQPFIRLITR